MDKKMKIGFVGYIRPDEPDFWENAKILADVGYKGCLLYTSRCV